MAAWQGGDRVEKAKSDLPYGVGISEFVIIQPALTKGSNDEWIIKPSQMQEIINSSKNFTGFLHVGCLSTGRIYGNEEPLGFKSCLGSLAVHPFKGPRPEPWQEYANLIINCTGCQMYFATSLTNRELWSVIFHLMIKQMIPNFPACNYIDCNQFERRSNLSSQEAGAICDLGLLSLLPDILMGSNGFSEQKRGFNGLGFMLKQKMNTLYDCDNFSEWLKFLVVKKMEQLQETLNFTESLLRGPKTKRG
ncbi:MAG: hypothetical protein NTX00_00180 [Candidatus Parcubacteria bacterium]|nr:hypothetical protein [Candidatus Parcubacteria bacterium]